jgi:hypothetical protein
MTIGAANWINGKPPKDVSGWYWIGTAVGITIVYLEGGSFFGIGTDKITNLDQDESILCHRKTDPDDQPKRDFSTGFSIEQVGYKSVL